jgi:hypothetical protein
MKAKLQRHLQKTFGIRPPYGLNNISYTYSIGAQFTIRFELGGELGNGTKERVEQATQRAITIFEETFENREEEIWLLVYDYPGEILFGRTQKFMQRQFSVAVYAGFYRSLERVYTSSEEWCKVKVLVGKSKVKHLKYASILNAIANAEMGFEPKLNETIFLLAQALTVCSTCMMTEDALCKAIQWTVSEICT